MKSVSNWLDIICLMDLCPQNVALLQQVNHHYYQTSGKPPQQPLLGPGTQHQQQQVAPGSTVVPQGHVQQMIQLINPSQPSYFHPSVSGTVTVSSAGGLVQHQLHGYQRGMSPVSQQQQQPAVALCTGGGSNSNSSTPAPSPSPLLTQQLQSMILGSPSSSSNSSPGIAATSGRYVQPQAPPPPYSQAQAQIQAARLGVITGFSSTASSSLGSDSTEPLRPSPLLDVTMLPELQHQYSQQHQMVQKAKLVASTAVSATRMPMSSNHMPVIMPSVRSKEVTKPMPQTATAPLAPVSSNSSSQNQHINNGNTGSGGIAGGSTTHNNYVSQFQAQINNHHNHHHNYHQQQQLQQQQHQLKQAGISIVVGQQQPQLTPRVMSSAMPQWQDTNNQSEEPSNTQAQQHVNSVVPQLLRNGGPGQAGGLTSEHLAVLAAASGGQPTTLAGRQQRGNHGPFNQPMLRGNGAAGLYRQINMQDTHGSSPCSESPILGTNHSPMSVQSTTTSPSTNSDIPDKPPPPYPGRGPPVLPPRRPIKQPPPFLPTDQKVISQHAQNFKVPSSIFSATFPSQVPGMASSSPSGLLSGSSATISLQLPVSSITVSSAPKLQQQGDTNSSPPPQVESSTPPSETDETDTDASSVSACTTSSSAAAIGAGIGGEMKPVNSQQETTRCLSPLPQRKSEARERDRLRCDTKVRVYSPQAFKFYMEQHVENVLKSHTQRMNRRLQLEKEMAKAELSEEAARQMRKMLHQKESNYIRLKRAKMDPCMFDKIKTLGVGAFGEVALVRKKDVGSLYAMKTLTKSNVIKRNQVAHVKAERDILAEADNEWVVKLYYSFQDEQNLYFVMDYVPGGDLMGQLIRKEILDEHLAQFYIAELVLAIESVHRMGFIHRDIKPDNILIDKDGHIKLTDFGLCTGFRWTHNSKYYQKGLSNIFCTCIIYDEVT